MVLAEIGVILGIIVGGLATLIAFQQHKSQRKTTSVNISMEMLKRFSDSDFRSTIQFLKSGIIPNDNWDRDRELLKLMNHFEDMGLFEKDGVLEMNHIKQLHGHVLNLIKTNEHTKRLRKEWSDKDPDYYFVFLKRLLEKI